MYMLKKGRKKGVTLIDIIIAFSIFLILLIPITNIIMQNIKTNKIADDKTDESMAISYGYENLKDLADKSSFIKNANNEKLVNGREVVYRGKLSNYVYTYTVDKVETYTTTLGETTPIITNENDDLEFNSSIVDFTLKIYKESSNDVLKEEQYTFKVKKLPNS